MVSFATTTSSSGSDSALWIPVLVLAVAKMQQYAASSLRSRVSITSRSFMTFPLDLQDVKLQPSARAVHLTLTCLGLWMPRSGQG